MKQIKNIGNVKSAKAVILANILLERYSIKEFVYLDKNIRYILREDLKVSKSGLSQLFSYLVKGNILYRKDKKYCFYE